MVGAESAKTSRKQVAAGFKTMRRRDFLKPGMVNLDVGGGRYDLGTEWLAENCGVENLVYDPYNRSLSWNRSVLEKVKNSPADCATIHNVLNVIPDRAERIEVVELALRYTTGLVYVTVYEKAGNGFLEYTGVGWQMNQPLSFYTDEINQFVNNVYAYQITHLLVIQKTPRSSNA